MRETTSEKIIYFIRDQARHIYRGGLPTLLRKGYALFLTIFALPLAFLIRILRPFVVVRFGFLPSSRIGHFAANVERYLCERDAGIHNPRNFDIFYYNAQISNYQLKKMWDRTLRICSFAKWLDKANWLLPGAQNHVVPLSLARDIYGFIGSMPVHLVLTPEEEHFGRKELEKLGITNGSPFVCFHARESTYLNKIHPDDDWSYHDYRDSSIHDYIPAAKELVGRGYFAIRMGAAVKERLPTTNPKIIDYAINGRSDFLDIFLSAKCRFFICSTVGLAAVPMIFRRPIIWVNVIPLEYVPAWSHNDLFIPKKLWLEKEKRFLTFREILDSEIGRFRWSQQYKKRRIEAIDNTPEEITALAIEMDQRLKDEWQTTEEGEELQRRFWSLFRPSELNQVFLSRIGTEFLHRNRDLLELG